MRRLMPAMFACAFMTTASAQPGVWVLTTTEPPGNPTLYATHFFDGNNGLVAGDDGGTGVMYRTANGGATAWTRVPLPGSPKALNEIFFVPGTTTGYVVGNENYVAITTNGGTSWTNRSIPSTLWGSLSDLHSVYFASARRGWVVGRVSGSNGPRMAATADSGKTWTEVPMLGPANNLYGIDFFDAARGLVVGTGYPPRKSLTTNGGNNWDDNATMNTTSPSASTSMYGLDALEGTGIAYAVGGFVIVAPRYPVIRRTTDYGVNWSNVVTASITGLSGPARDVVMNGDSVIYVTGEDGGLVRSTDAGSSWTAETVPALGSDDLFKFSQTDDNYIYAVGTSGRVIRTRVTPNATFTSSSGIDFGTLCPGASAQRSFLIGNDGLGMLEVTGTSLTQPPGGWIEFEVVQPTPSRIWARQTEQVRINVRVFDGAPAGTHVGQIRVGTSDENYRGADTFRVINLTVSVPPNGVGIDSAVVRDAGPVRIGSLRALPLNGILRNVSPNCVTAIDTVYLARGRDYRIVGVPIVRDTLRPTDRRSIQIEFAPSATCLRHDTIVVVPIGGAPAVRIPIVGTGVEPTYAASPADTLRFGGVQIGGSGAQTLRLVNRKTGACLDRTALRSLRIEGPNASEFSTTVSFTPGVSFIPADGEVSIPITTSPIAAGPRVAYAIIEHELSGEPDTVVLLVRGVDAELTASTDEIVFPVTEVGTRFDTTLIDGLRNLGASAVKILSTSIFGADAAAFELVAPAIMHEVPGNATDSIVLGFTPTRIGTFEALLEIVGDDGSTLRIRLRGEGDVASGRLGRDPIVFAPTEVASCRTITVDEFIINTGRVPLRVRSIVLVPHPRNANGDAASFAIVSPVIPPDQLIAPGDSLALTIQFCPQRLGEHVAGLQVTTNIPSVTLLDTLIAEGIRAGITAVDGVSFGAVRVGTVRDTTIDPFLVNNDIDPMDVTSITFVGANASEFAVTSPTVPASIAARSTLPLDLRFAPTARGVRSATMRVVSTRGTYDIEISGQGVYPAIDVVGAAAPRVRIGQRRDVIVQIRNSGDDAGVVGAASVSGAPSFFIGASQTPATLLPGDTRDVLVTFAPDALCAHTTTLTLSADGLGGRYTTADTALAITGFGVAPFVRSIDTSIVFTGTPVDTPRDSVLASFIVNLDVADPSHACVDSTTIERMSIVGLDAGSFTIVAPTDPRTSLAAGALLPMTIRFLPRRSGAHVATLEVYFDGSPDSVLRVQLIGNAASEPVVFAGLSFGPDQSARPGSLLRVPITLAGDLASLAVDSIVVDVAYHKSLLRLERVVTGPGRAAVASQPRFDARNAHSTINITSNVGLSGTIAELEFTVLLGRVLVGDVFADSAFVLGRPNIRIASDSASVSIAEFCDADGRLITFGGDLLVRATPNPASSHVLLEYNVPARGPTRLILYDAAGRAITALADADLEPGRYTAELDTRSLTSGTYYCVLTAGVFTSATIIRVEK